jgi:8-hydroxy-5-deazaflavin:NADPH oxidoreductase
MAFSKRAAMSVGVVGAGGMGRVLARQLVRLGYRVTIANSREPESLAAFAAELGAATARVVDLAVESEVVFLAIPTRAVTALPRGLFTRSARSPIVIDVSNYHPELRDGRIEAIESGALESQWVAQQLAHPVIKACNTILATSLLEKGCPKGSQGRIALPVAGDSPGAKAVVLQLVDELGFDPADAGALDESWRQQTGTPAYCKDLPLALLQRALAAAERSRSHDYRAAREAELKAS